MSDEPIRNSSSNSEPDQPSGTHDTVADLKREVEQLRAKLAVVSAEAESYRRAAYSFLKEQFPYVPPTEEELQDLLHGPRGRSILEIIEELKQEREG